ncbi:MAG: hypothetical protein KDJ29_07090, partial [Hyphomicrobiales bacterium]|nr:hypothetical protein [Hyphomicrobiales bacterium]
VTSGAPARFVTKWSGKVIGILPDRKTLTALLPGGSGAEKPSQPGLDPNTGPAFASASTIGSAPLPPPRPGRADAAGDDRPDGAAGHIAKLPRIISGGYATLPAQFSAYAPLR